MIALENVATSRRRMLGLLISAGFIGSGLFARPPQPHKKGYAIMVDEDGGTISELNFHMNSGDDNKIVLVNLSTRPQRFKFPENLFKNPKDSCVRLNPNKHKSLKPNNVPGKYPYTICADIDCGDPDCARVNGDITIDSR